MCRIWSIDYARRSAESRFSRLFVVKRIEGGFNAFSVRGVTEADAQMLRNSGFLNRLLHAADDPAADPVQLIMAVVRADDIADTRFREDKSKKRREHFAEVCAQAEEQTKKQLGEHLR